MQKEAQVCVYWKHNQRQLQLQQAFQHVSASFGHIALYPFPQQEIKSLREGFCQYLYHIYTCLVYVIVQEKLNSIRSETRPGVLNKEDNQTANDKNINVQIVHEDL